jgi:hypothetical protein
VLRSVGAGAVVVAGSLLVAGAPIAPAAGSPAVVAGFDHGNQSPNPLTRLFQNVNLSTLPQIPFTRARITATDDVPGSHLADDPLALQAQTGVAFTDESSEFGPFPPDTQIAAGAGFVVQAVNNTIAVMDRTGTPLTTVSTNSLFGVSNTSDPKIVFDAGAGVWYVTDIEAVQTDAGDAIDLAVSHTSDPTGLWDVYRVWTAASNRLADQPRLGFSADKVLVELTNFDKLSFPSLCLTCFDDFMIVIQKSDLTSLSPSPEGIAIDLSTETNHRFSMIPAIPLPSAEVPTAYAAYRGSDLLGDYESTLVIVGTPAAADVAFKETGPGVQGVSNPPAAAQPGVSPNVLNSGDTRMLSVSLVKASTLNFSATLWTSSGTGCSEGGETRACARIDKVNVSSGGDASVPIDFNLGEPGNDLLYPAVVGDTSGDHVWVADSVTGSVFPTSELRLLTFKGTGLTNSRTITYGSGAFAYTTDQDKQNASNTLETRFGDYSGIFVDPSESSGATVWAATENAAPTAGGHWRTSIVEATFLRPTVTSVTPQAGFAGDVVDVFGSGFSEQSLVRFGGTVSTLVGFLGSDHLQAVVPPQAPTTVNVLVTTTKGTDTPLPGPPLPFPSVPDRFTYQSLLWASGTDPAGNVVAVDPATDTRHFSVSAPGPTVGVALSPDGGTVFATIPSTGQVESIDAATGLPDGLVNVGVTPTEIAVAQDGAYAFVTDPGAFGGTGGVIPIALSPNAAPKPQKAVAVPDPRGVATTASGQVYVTSGSGRRVVILTRVPCPVVVKWCPTTSIAVPTGTPGPVASGPDRVWLGVAGPPSAPSGTVYSIDPALPPALSSPLFLDHPPSAMAVTPNGQFAFAISTAAGVVYPIGHAPPNPDVLLPPVTLAATPLGGGVASFDSSTLFVAGGSSGQINAVAVPSAVGTSLTSGPATSAELATDLPPTISCGGAAWGRPTTGMLTSSNPVVTGTTVTVVASLPACPPPAPAPATAVPTLTVHPPSSPSCPTSYKESEPAVTLSPGMDTVVTFSFQFSATCAGTWKATPSLAKFTGPPPLPPKFKAATTAVGP